MISSDYKSYIEKQVKLNEDSKKVSIEDFFVYYYL